MWFIQQEVTKTCTLISKREFLTRLNTLWWWKKVGICSEWPCISSREASCCVEASKQPWAAWSCVLFYFTHIVKIFILSWTGCVDYILKLFLFVRKFVLSLISLFSPEMNAEMSRDRRVNTTLRALNAHPAARRDFLAKRGFSDAGFWLLTRVWWAHLN